MTKDKLRHLINTLGLTPESFATSLDVGKSGIYKILRGETKKISSNLARKITTKYTQYSYDEIMSFNNIDENELIFKGSSKIEVQKIVDIIMDNIEKFKDNEDFKSILKEHTLTIFDEYKKSLEKN